MLLAKEIFGVEVMPPRLRHPFFVLKLLRFFVVPPYIA
jgi:hypothetical protein